jgi:hypothetical protein
VYVPHPPDGRRRRRSQGATFARRSFARRVDTGATNDDAGVDDAVTRMVYAYTSVARVACVCMWMRCVVKMCLCTSASAARAHRNTTADIDIEILEETNE